MVDPLFIDNLFPSRIALFPPTNFPLKMKPKKATRLPNEIQREILKFLPSKYLNNAMRVNKYFYQTGKKLLYRDIRFYSVNQRDKFFELLSATSNSMTSPTSPLSPELRSPDEQPPAVRIPRRRSPRLNQPCDIANLIHSIDFGLRPREISKKEPPLPCTKVWTSPTKPSSLPLINAESPGIGSFHRHGVVDRMTVSLAQRRVDTPTLDLAPRKKYGEWEDRFISKFIPTLAEMIPNLVKLNLCGSHLSKNDITIVLSGMPNLEWLDISYTTLKADALSAISRYCRTKLAYLNLSGIFKFGRNKSSSIIDMVMYCEGLKTLVLLDCPEFYGVCLEECLELSQGRIKFITDEELRYD